MTYRTQAICNFDGCLKPVMAKGLCNGHNAQKTRGNELKPLKNPSVVRICDFPDCGRGHFGHGLCLGHYRQKQKGTKLKPLFHREPVKECRFEGCKDLVVCKELCGAHYSQFKTHGKLVPTQKQILNSFKTWTDHAQYVIDLIETKTNEIGCILCISTNTQGYKGIRFAGQSWTAHRVVTALKLGYDSMVPLEGQPVHHICANRACINPDHLELVTESENIAEMLARNAYIYKIEQLETELALLKEENKKLKELNGCPEV